jgi:exopolysaccharide biosynthesis operon protein EpsL
VSRRQRCRAALLLPALLVVGMAQQSARADAEDVFNVVVGASLTRDDNLFRLPPGSNPQLLLGKSSGADWITTTSLGLRIDKPWSLQRFQLDATATVYRYRSFSYLDFDGLDYRAAWRWQLTPRLTGSLTADRQQALINYADYRTNYTVRNTRTNDDRHFDADWWLHGSWHLIGGISEYQGRNTQTFNAQDDFRLNSAEAGAKYVAESGSSVSLLGRSGRGDYLNRVVGPGSLYDNHFDQHEAELRASWLVSGKSNLDGTLSHVERRHEHFANLDYSGTTGRLDYRWTPTGKLQVDFVAARDIASYQDLSPYGYQSTYYVADSLSIAPLWQVGAKTALRLRYDQSQRDFRGDMSPSLLLPYQRNDKPRTLLLGIDWAPTRTLSVSGTLQWDRRSSNITGLDYNEASAGFTAQLAF